MPLSPVLHQWRPGPMRWSFPTIIVDGREYVIVREEHELVLREYEQGDETVYQPDEAPAP